MLKLAIILGCLTLVYCYPKGAPIGPDTPNLCVHMIPGHYFPPMNSTVFPAPYTISASSSTYKPDGNYVMVTLNATQHIPYHIKGFLVMARRADCTSTDPVGMFTPVNTQAQAKTCSSGKYVGNVVTHTNNTEKVSSQFLWNNPVGGHVYFQFSVVYRYDTFWTHLASGVLFDEYDMDRNPSWCAGGRNIDVNWVDPARLTTTTTTTMVVPTVKDDHHHVDGPFRSAGTSITSFNVCAVLALIAALAANLMP